jgi:hypothetical protein
MTVTDAALLSAPATAVLHQHEKHLPPSGPPTLPGRQPYGAIHCQRDLVERAGSIIFPGLLYSIRASSPGRSCSSAAFLINDRNTEPSVNLSYSLLAMGESIALSER